MRPACFSISMTQPTAASSISLLVWRGILRQYAARTHSSATERTLTHLPAAQLSVIAVPDRGSMARLAERAVRVMPEPGNIGFLPIRAMLGLLNICCRGSRAEPHEC